MVKKTILLLASLMIILPSPAKEIIPAPIPGGITEPKWEDFCELGYEKAKIYDDDSLINIVSVIKAERVKQTYWAKRRQSFETSLTLCRAAADSDKQACFDDLSAQEEQKNKIYTSKRKEYVYFKRPFLNTSRTL